MTSAEFWLLMERLWTHKVPLNPQQEAAVLQYLRERLSINSIEDFKKIAERLNPKPEPKPNWLRRLFTPKVIRGLKFGLYAALAYLLVAAIHDSTVSPTPINSGTGICDTAAGVVPLSISVKSRMV